MNESRPEDSEEATPEEESRELAQSPAGEDSAKPSASDSADEAGADAVSGSDVDSAPADEGGAGDTPSEPEISTEPERGDNGRSGGGGWVIALSLLLALAAAGAAGALGWRLYQLERRVAGIPAERAAALQPYLRPDALQPLRARIETLEAGRARLSEDLDQRLDQVEEVLESLRALTERHQIGWRLAEIRYLLSVAARRLTIAHDAEGAEAALAAADDAVAGLHDVRLIPLRKSIIEDLGAVRAVQPADIEGIALRLQSLLDQVDALPLAPLKASGRSGSESNAVDGWVGRVLGKLSDYVVVRRRPGGPSPVVPRDGTGLDPSDSLTLALEDALRAALARDDERYRQALQRAADALAGHYDRESGTTIRFREGLADLGRRSVDTSMPDLTDTLELARRLAREIEHSRREALPEAPSAPDPEPVPEG